MDLAVSHAVLRRVSGGELATTLRVYCPRVPMVAFGRRDTHRPGFAAAAQACRNAGFTPAVLDDADVIRPLLSEVYRGLDLPLERASLGSVRAEAPGVDVDDLKCALLTAYAGNNQLEPGALDPDTLELAKRLLPDHQV